MTTEMKVYAKPGTSEWVRASAYDVPEGYVEMSGYPPLMGQGTYVADASGEWIIPTENYTEAYNENVRACRASEYEKIASLKDQLEAILEYHQGRPEKLDEIASKFQEVREKYKKI